jgi:hypothetical protein
MPQNLLAKFLDELGLQLLAGEIEPDCLRVRAVSTQPPRRDVLPRPNQQVLLSKPKLELTRQNLLTPTLVAW